MPTERRQLIHAGLIILSVASFIATVVVNSFASIPELKGLLFNSSTGEISNAYNVTITPSNDTFLIWTAIYSWLGLMLAYFLSTLCLKNSDDGKAFYTTKIFSPVFHVLFVINMALNVAWICTWDAQLMVESTVILFLLTLMTYSCLITSYATTTYGYVYYTDDEVLKNHGWAIILLIHNGLTFYAAWTTIACLLNVAIAVKDVGDTYIDDVSLNSILLAIFMLEFFVYFVLETVIVKTKRILRYTVSHYIVIGIAVSGILMNGIPKDNTVYYLLIGLLIELGLFASIKLSSLVFNVYRHNCKKEDNDV